LTAGLAVRPQEQDKLVFLLNTKIRRIAGDVKEVYGVGLDDVVAVGIPMLVQLMQSITESGFRKASREQDKV
jgi:hypothetical protein